MAGCYIRMRPILTLRGSTTKMFRNVLATFFDYLNVSNIITQEQATMRSPVQSCWRCWRCSCSPQSPSSTTSSSFSTGPRRTCSLPVTGSSHSMSGLTRWNIWRKGVTSWIVSAPLYHSIQPPVFHSSHSVQHLLPYWLKTSSNFILYISNIYIHDSIRQIS